jgi:hypothetical protein
MIKKLVLFSRTNNGSTPNGEATPKLGVHRCALGVNTFDFAPDLEVQHCCTLLWCSNSPP